MNTNEINKQDSLNKNEELIERHEIENTPFTIIKVEGKYFGSMGQYRLTEPQDTKEGLEVELKAITWNRLIQVISILMETQKNVPLESN